MDFSSDDEGYYSFDDDYDMFDYDPYSSGMGYVNKRKWDEREVTFYRPDGEEEGKSIGWCKSNGFFEIEPGLWSGDWYWRHFPNAKEEINERKRQARLEIRQRQMRKAQRELEKIREREKFKCPIPGCWANRFPGFQSKNVLEEHLIKTKGKAHARYRNEHFEKCPVQGCQKRFPRDNETWLQSHFEYSRDMKHVQYCRENDIFSYAVIFENTERLKRYISDGTSLSYKVISEFTIGSGRILLEDLHLFEEHSIDEVLDEDAYGTTEWLEAVSKARQRAETFDKTNFAAERLFMQKWLKPKPKARERVTTKGKHKYTAERSFMKNWLVKA